MKSKIESPITETMFLILLSLISPNHGYQIAQEVEEMTRGRIRFGPGTLYGAINSLEKKGWISVNNHEGNSERKKIYVITEIGKETLDYEIERMKDNLKIAESVLEGNHEKI